MQLNSQFMLRRFSMKYEAPICEMMNMNSEDIIRTSDTSYVPVGGSDNISDQNQDL